MKHSNPNSKNKQTRNADKFDRYAQKGWSGFSEKEANSIKKSLQDKINSTYSGHAPIYRLPGKIMLVAASVGLLLFAAFLFRQEASPQYVSLGLVLRPDVILTTIPLASEKGGTDMEKAALLQKGVEQYEKGDFQAAALYFKTYLEQENIRQEVLLYYGQTLLETEPEQAIIYFDKLISNTDLDQVYVDYAEWFKVWALMNINQKAAAVELLEKISSSPSICQKDAAKLLVSLDKG